MEFSSGAAGETAFGNESCQVRQHSQSTPWICVYSQLEFWFLEGGWRGNTVYQT